MSAPKPFVFFILGPILGLVATWILCLGSRPDSSCGDGVMIVVPFFSIIGIILGIASFVGGLKQGGGDQNVSNNIATENTLSNAIDNTVEVKKVGVGRLLFAILVGFIFVYLVNYVIAYLGSYMNLHTLTGIIGFPVMVAVFYLVVRKIVYY